jgi:hypothetical protein
MEAARPALSDVFSVEEFSSGHVVEVSGGCDDASAATTDGLCFSVVAGGCSIDLRVSSAVAADGSMGSGVFSIATGCFTKTLGRIGIAPGRGLACAARLWTAATGFAGREGWSSFDGDSDVFVE